MDLRAYVFGIMTGIFVFVASMALVSWAVGVKWQPVVAAQHR